MAKNERLALRVSDAFLSGLDQLSEEEQSSRADIIRRAVALYAFARDEARQGRKLGFFTEEGGRQVVKEVVAL
jgi:predicted transcriptional regulator